jgi:hypothetical protein
LNACCIVSNFVKIPIIGGRRINARNITIAVKYVAYLGAFFDDSAFKASETFCRYVILSTPVVSFALWSDMQA